MVRTHLTANGFLVPTRRCLMAGFGAAALTAMVARAASAQAPQTLRLEAKPAAIPLRPNEAPTPIWGLEPSVAPLRLKIGQADVTFRNGLPVPTVLDWRGIDGAAAAEPLTARAPVSPGGEVSFSLPLRRAGTYFADLRLLASADALPSRPLPFVVEESAPIAVDRDALFLIDAWRLQPAAATGDPPVFTVNGQVMPDIPIRSGERLRLRFINGSQEQVIAVKMEGLAVRVIAMDSAPAEPFPARNGALVLAPGGRADALIDVTAPPGSATEVLLHDGQQARPVARLVASSEAPIRSNPLPSAPGLAAEGLPVQLDLKGALRVELALQGGDWVTPASFSASLAPAFKVKAGRTVVLTLTSSAELATSFHLHGHHFRWLDRLDDGWKPFWLDTLVVEPGQTQRVAFAAAFPGRWLLESTATRSAAPRRVRWFDVG